MKKYFSGVIFCLFLTSCLAQNRSSNSSLLVNQIYESQLAYYNANIADKDNYSSIINFAKTERSTLFKRIGSVVQSDSFIILEGFSPGWGNFVGLVWNRELAYSYKKLSTDKKLHITKTNLSGNNVKHNTGIDPFIIKKISEWDVNYIRNIKNKIGMGVSDGHYFIATKVTKGKTDHDYIIENIAFEQFAE